MQFLDGLRSGFASGVRPKKQKTAAAGVGDLPSCEKRRAGIWSPARVIRRISHVFSPCATSVPGWKGCDSRCTSALVVCESALRRAWHVGHCFQHWFRCLPDRASAVVRHHAARRFCTARADPRVGRERRDCEQPWVDAMRVVRKRDRAMDHFRKALRKAKRIPRNLHKTRPSENLVVSAGKNLSPSMQIHEPVSPAIKANNDTPQPFESQCLPEYRYLL